LQVLSPVLPAKPHLADLDLGLLNLMRRFNSFMGHVKKMKHISQVEHLAYHPPAYATWIPTRLPEVQYQNRRSAAQCIRNNWEANLDQNLRMTLFKYDPKFKRYISIFDNQSELAQEIRDGKLSLSEVLKSIDW